ncbi:MAG TPA: hypothetical protein VIM18_08900 [Solirubrobacteraceae bacterium]
MRSENVKATGAGTVTDEASGGDQPRGAGDLPVRDAQQNRVGVRAVSAATERAGDINPCRFQRPRERRADAPLAN